jgi:hypothetical protein
MFFRSTIPAARSLPGRSLGIAGWRMPAGSFPILRLALLLAALASISGARAETPEPLAVDVFFDLAADDLAEAGANAGDAAPAAGELLIAGIPLRISAQDDAADAGWRTVAGANGSYTMPITGQLSMVGRAQVVNTDFVDVHSPDKAVASLATDFRYASGRWTLGLQPGVEITRWETEIVQRDSTVEGRASMALGGGLSIATTGRYRWRQTTADEALDREIASGRVGVVYRLPEAARLELAYATRVETAHDAAVLFSAGPSVFLSLPVDQAIDLSASYGFTETMHYEAADTTPGEQAQDQHRLGLAMTWDIGGDAADIDLSAAYAFELGSTVAGEPDDDSRHVATFSFAFSF